MEAGEMRYLRGRRPALRVGWYGSQVLLVFDNVATRDAASALLSATA
jgi:IMP dehydrogenase/GMP reductase